MTWLIVLAAVIVVVFLLYLLALRYDQGRFPGEDGQHLLQQRDVVLRTLQRVVFQLLRRQILDLHVRPGGAPQGSVRPGAACP